MQNMEQISIACAIKNEANFDMFTEIYYEKYTGYP